MPDINGKWTTEDLIKIKAAIASGALEVEYNDRKVRYKSLNDLLKAKEMIERELGLKKRGGGRVLCSSSKGTC